MKSVLFTIAIATVCAAALADTTTVVRTGLDNLVDSDFAMLRGKNIVLVSHAAARSYRGRTSVEEFQQSPWVQVLRVLTPEHGFYGIEKAGKHISDDTVGTLPFVSLYGQMRRPPQHLLSDADAVIVDLQDIGCRSYTYVSTMVEVMEACAKFQKPLYVLDRPNPLGGQVVDGVLPDSNVRNFVCRIPVPYVHGMTLGELASMTNAKGWLEAGENGFPTQCSLVVVRCKGWKRKMKWDETGLPWYPTSPNIPSVHSAFGYAITGLLGELGWCSIGIGTTSPFTIVGAPWFRPDTLLEARLWKTGVVPMYGSFLPGNGMFKNQHCHGYILSCGRTVYPFSAALALMVSVRDADSIAKRAWPERQSLFNKAIGNANLVQLLRQGASWQTLHQISRLHAERFLADRLPYLLY